MVAENSSQLIERGLRLAGSHLYMRMPPHPSLAVVVADQKRLAAAGEQGVLARSGFLPRSYFGDAKKTAETFVEIAGRRYALTGDAAVLDTDGSITVMGRGSNCINTGGEKVFPEEVEEVLRAHPQVLDAVVVGLPDSRWGERVTALVASRPGVTLDVEALRGHCRAALASYKVPKDVAFVPSIERSPAGKADYVWARKRLIAAL